MQSDSRVHPLKPNTLCVACLFLLSLAIMLRQVVTPAYFSVMVDDTYAYSSWAFQFSEALREGIVYPRWMPLDLWSYGSPTFIVYPPLSFYIVAFFHIFTDSITIAMNLTRFMSLFLSGIGIFFLIKEIYTEKTAVMAATFYILIPYNVMQFYLLGSFASTVSLMWFSPILSYVYKYAKTSHNKYLTYAAICYGGLILTHIINAYMFTFVVLAFLLYLSTADKRPFLLFSVVYVIVTGVLLSAAYTVPLLYEKKLVNLDTFFTEGSKLYFANNFILPRMTDKTPSNFFWPVYYPTFAVAVVFFCIIALLFIISINASVRLEGRKDAKNFHNLFFSIIVATIFLLFGPSRFLWEHVPFLKYIHTPIRWLNITAFAIALLFGSYYHKLLTVPIKKRELYFSISLIALMIGTFTLLDYYYVRHANTFTEQELIPVRNDNSSRDHLPVGVDIKKLDRSDKVVGNVTITKGKGIAEVKLWKSAERVVDVKASQPLTVRIRTFDFPGWTAYLDDIRTEITTESGTRAMIINIPDGDHRLKLIFKDTPARFYGKIVSIFTFLILTTTLLCDYFRVPSRHFPFSARSDTVTTPK